MNNGKNILVLSDETSIDEQSEQREPNETGVYLEAEVESDAEEIASRLHEMIKQASDEAKLEKSAAPSPKTARLSYSAYSDMRPSDDSIYAPAGIFTYFWLLILASIPVIGFISAVIIAFAAKKLAIKRVATAIIAVQTLILLIVAVFVSLSVFVWETNPLDFVKDTFEFLKNYFG